MDDPRDRSTLLFLSLVAGLGQAGFQQLGKVQNPFTGKVERDLGAARTTIDTIGALEERTRGNLSEDEQRMLQRTLTELRLNYVDEVKRGEAEPATPAADEAPSDATPPDSSE